MKQIPILSGKAMIVELPAVSLVFEVHRGCFFVAGINVQDVELKKRKIDYGDRRGFLAFQGRWRIIGMLSEVTEQQAAVMVEGGEIPFDETANAYRNYSYKSEWGAMWLSTAIESLESAILAAGFYFENPYGKDEPVIDDPDPHSQYYGAQQDELTRWHHALSRVLDRSRCLLLGREGV